MGIFKHLSKPIFGSPEVQKDISYEGQFLFENIQN